MEFSKKVARVLSNVAALDDATRAARVGRTRRVKVRRTASIALPPLEQIQFQLQDSGPGSDPPNELSVLAIMPNVGQLGLPIGKLLKPGETAEDGARREAVVREVIELAALAAHEFASIDDDA